MYTKIKELADEAIALQNKDRMDEVLREISGICRQAMQDLAPLEAAIELANDMCANRTPAADISTSTAADGMWSGAPNPVVLGVPVVEIVAPSGFGLAHIEMEGCAIHPDDTAATMTDEQRARQLAAHELDIAAGGPAKPKVTPGMQQIIDPRFAVTEAAIEAPANTITKTKKGGAK